ncbi:MAG: hypothetical protein AB1665_09230 [Candidatus Thermoplasmatota archaeon]
MAEEEMPRKEVMYPYEECHPSSFRTLLTEDKKHRLIVCCPKGEYDEEKKACKVSIKLHSIHHEHEGESYP